MPKDQNNKDAEDSKKTEHPAEGVSIDLDNILLPDKQLHTPGNAQRASAGALLAQEQKAVLPKPPPAPPALPTAPLPPAPQNNESSIAPLQTFESDIQKILGGGDVSAVSIAAAESKRTHLKPQEVEAIADMGQEHKEGLSRTLVPVLLVIGAVALTVAAAGAVAYVILRPTSVPVAPSLQVPFISVDDVKTLLLQPSDGRDATMNGLSTLKSSEHLSAGLIASFTPVLASSTPAALPVAISAQQFFSVLTPNMPTNLLENIEPSFLIGVHSFNGNNEPLIVMSTDSYEQGYAGMLAWEATMPQDLAPFFPMTTGARGQTVAVTFIDKVIANHDARALLDQSGNPVLLWTFLDRQTIVITTNQYTLGEIISRLKNPSITPVPGQ